MRNDEIRCKRGFEKCDATPRADSEAQTGQHALFREHVDVGAGLCLRESYIRYEKAVVLLRVGHAPGGERWLGGSRNTPGEKGSRRWRKQHQVQNNLESIENGSNESGAKSHSLSGIFKLELAAISSDSASCWPVNAARCKAVRLQTKE